MNDNHFFADVPAPASPGVPQNTPAPGGGAAYPAPRPAEPWQFAPPAPREAVPAGIPDGAAALLTYAGAWWFLRLFWEGYLGLGMFLFTAAFAGVTLVWRRWAGLEIPRRSWGWLGVMLLAAGSLVVLDGGLLSWLVLFFLMLTAAYWAAAVGGTRVEDRLGEWLAADLVNHLLVVPFQNFGCLPAVLKNTLSKTRLGKNIGIGLLSLACSLPLLWFVCRELSAVAAGFGEMLAQLGRVISVQNILSMTTLLAIPTAFYLFGLLYGCQHRRYTGTFTAEKLEESLRRWKVLPRAAAYTLLTVLCLLYALFFVIGAAELIAFPRGSLTPYQYARFAREGFFELCRVSVVNLLVLWGLRLFLNDLTQRSTAPTRIFQSLLCCQTLLLIALALCKMGLYIRFCGVTWLRVCTTWFMVLLAAVFGLMLLAQFRPIPLVRWIAISFCALFLVLCWMDVDGLVVKNAIWRYERLGDTGAISFGELIDHTTAGAPELYGLWQREAAKGGTPVSEVLEELMESSARGLNGTMEQWSGFSHYNVQRARAWHLYRQFLPQPKAEKPQAAG